jgi:hypothetical protein
MARPKPLENKVPLTISVPVSLKEAFVAACAKADTQASQVLRQAMREFIEKNKETL